MQSPKRILIYNVNWLGDALFSTATIKAVRKAYPDCFLASIIPPRCQDVLKDNPHLNEIILFDEKRADLGLIGLIKFIHLLRKKKFDTCLILHRSMTRTLITFLAGIPRRIGYSYKKRDFLLTDIVPLPDMDRIHRADYYLKLAEAIGVHTDEGRLEFYFSEKDRIYACRLLKESGIEEGDFCVVINPGGNWMPKRWPKENFSSLSDRLISDFDAKVVFTGAKTDIALVGEIIAGTKIKPVDFAGRFNLKQLGALFLLVDIVISADSAPVHIANTIGAKVICLFGPTSPEVTGPYPRGDNIVLQKDIGCEVPCYNLQCDDNRCMKAISVEDVLDAVGRIKEK